MDREGIRRLAAETLGLPTSPYKFCDSLAELQAAIDAGISYPCIVKPVMSSSGKGQSKIDSPADVQKAWDYAMAGGRVGPGRVIVEGFIAFDYEITQLTVRALGASGQVETHFCDPIGHVQVSGDYVESWQPHPMSAVALERSRQIAKAVTDNLGGQGLFGVELFVQGDMVWFSEVSPRPHDTGMVTMITQWQNEFELHARAILGLPVDTTLKSPGASAVIYGGVDATGIVFDGVADALRVPNSEVRLFGKPESFVTRRMGWWSLVPGDLLQPIYKGMGLKKGEKQQLLGCQIEVVEAYAESLDAITHLDVILEGFPTWTPEQFVEFFCKKNHCPPTIQPNRIAFKYRNDLELLP
jgi:phosphoribosylglycinamide formyltransferase 2